MKQTGLNPPAIARRAAERGAEVSEGTIKAILRGESRNAGIFTWEAIALGMDLPPLQIIAELFGEELTDLQIINGQSRLIQEIYKELTGAKRAKADVFLEGFIHNLQRIKDQPK